MDTKDAATPAAPATTTQGTNTTTTEDEDEMPLLYMDQLPSNFAQNSQLAAIATFMASDDDAADEDAASEAGTGSKQRRQRHRKATKANRRQKPYAKPEKETKNMKNGVETKSADTKELQLFLSLFHVS